MDQAIGTTAGQVDGVAATSIGQTARAEERARDKNDAIRSASGRQFYAGREWSSGHPLNIRLSIPIGIGRYYVAFVAGKERRARARLALDRRLNPLDTPSNVLFLTFIATIATAGSVAIFYLLLADFFGWSGRLFL